MSLNWLQIIYALLVSACLTLAAVQITVWWKIRSPVEGLLFPLGGAVALLGFAIIELSLSTAATPAEYGELVRWLHVPSWLIVLITVAFVFFRLHAGRWWLAVAACGLRTLALIVNFLVDPNLNFSAITGLKQISFLGNTVVIAEGVASPWALLSQLSYLLLLVFVGDATLSLWRRGDRQQAAIFGGSLLFFIISAPLITVLIVFGVLQWPPLITLCFAPVVFAMSHEISRRLINAAGLDRQLQAASSELQRARERLQLATERAKVAVWEWDMARDEIWTNAQGRELFGIPAGEPINMARLLDIVHPDERDSLLASLTRSRNQAEHFDRDYRLLSADGQTRWVAVRGQWQPHTGHGESILHGVVFDVSEARLAEARFRCAIEVSPIGKLLSDDDGRIVYANPMAEGYFGSPPGTLAGTTINTLLPGHGRIAEAITGNEHSFALDFNGQRLDGSTIPLQMSITRLPCAQGSTLLTTLIDISERKQREDDLWRERNFFREVIDTNPCLIFVKDQEGRFRLVNKRVAELYGTTPAELIGKRDADFNLDAEQVAAFRRDDRDVLSSDQELLISEEMITDAGGQTHYFQTIKRPIRERDGSSRMLLGVSTDISARKLSEQEIERQRNELAHLSRVTSLSELSGSLAHELNQPLAAILANAQAAVRFLANDQPDLDELREILRDIIEDDRHAGGVIQGLRLLLKKGEMRREAIDLNGAVGAVLKLTRSDLLNADVRVSTALAADLPMIFGDRVQLQQVLLNLVVNASEAMAGQETENRQLHIATRRAGDDLVQVEVADRGHGIAPDDLERIFTPFVTTKGQGLGLGLSVCQRIIAAHGGQLTARNNAEGGATFCFTVPAYSGETT